MTRRIAVSSLLVLAISLAASSRARASATEAQIDTYNRAVEAHNARVNRYERTTAEFNNERDAFNHAAAHYNSLAPDQRTDFQLNRLKRWYAHLQQRLPQLNQEWDALAKRSAELDAWRNRLDS